MQTWDSDDCGREFIFAKVVIGAFCLVIAGWQMPQYGQDYCPSWLIVALLGCIPSLILVSYHKSQLQARKTNSLSADRPEEAFGTLMAGMDGCEYIFLSGMSGVALWVGILIHTIVNDEGIMGLILSVTLFVSSITWSLTITPGICRWIDKRTTIS